MKGNYAKVAWYLYLVSMVEKVAEEHLDAIIFDLWNPFAKAFADRN